VKRYLINSLVLFFLICFMPGPGYPFNPNFQAGKEIVGSFMEEVEEKNHHKQGLDRFLAQVQGGKICEDRCDKEYKACLDKGIDLGTFVSAPKSIVKRMCADEHRICQLECRMEYHLKLR